MTTKDFFNKAAYKTLYIHEMYIKFCCGVYNYKAFTKLDTKLHNFKTAEPSCSKLTISLVNEMLDFKPVILKNNAIFYIAKSPHKFLKKKYYRD